MAVIGLGCLALGQVAAATRTWTGGAGYSLSLGKWSIAANWSPVGRPQPGDSIVFPPGVYTGVNTNDLAGLTLSWMTVHNDLWVRGQPLTITGGIQVDSDAHVVFDTDVTWGGAAAAPIEINVHPGRCEFYETVNFNGHRLDVMGGKQTNDNAAAVGFAELGSVRGNGTIRIVADPAFPEPVGVSMAGNLTGFTGQMLVERGQGAVGAHSGWPGQVVVGTGAGDPARFIFHAGSLTTNSVVEVFPGAEVVADAGEAGGLRFHGGRLTGRVRVTGAVTQLPNAEPVEIVGEVTLDQPVQVVQAAGMRIEGTLKPTLDTANVTLVKRGPGVLSLEGASNLRAAVKVEEGTLRVTEASGLGQSDAGTTVHAGATLVYDLGSQSSWDDPSQTVDEPLTLEGHASVPALVGGEVLSFRGPLTLLGPVIVRAEGELALAGPISGPGRLRAQARADGRMLLRNEGKTYTGGTEMMSGRMDLPSGLEIPSKNVDEGRLIIGGAAGEPAEVSVTDLGAHGEWVAVEVQPTGKLLGLGEITYPASLRLAAGARVQAESELRVADEKIDVAALPAGTAVVTGRIYLEHFESDEFLVDMPGIDTVLQLNGSLIFYDPARPVTLLKSGPGTLVLAGSLPNHVDGDLQVDGGRLVLDKSGGAAWRRGQIKVGTLPDTEASLILQGFQQLHPDVAVQLGSGGALELPGPRPRPEPVGTLAGGGVVHLGAGATLQAGMGGGSAEFGGTLVGAGEFTKAGAGTLRLSGTNEHTGLTRVTGGTLVVDGFLKSSALWVTNGASLAGTGVVRTVTVTAGSLLSPGVGPGRLTTGDLSLLAGSRLRMEIQGNGPGTGFDQLDVAGTVQMSGVYLDLVPGFIPDLGATFRLIDNDGTDLIQGNFQNLPEGAIVTNGLAVYRLTYASGNRSNDAVLEVMRLEGAAGNQAPVVVAPGDRTVAEGDTLSFALTATDPEGDSLRWEMTGAVPAGVSLNPGTGQFAWTPTEAQGPGTYALTVRVTDSANPPASSLITFQVAVTEENTVPQVQPPGDVVLLEGETLDVTILAADADVPAQQLTFSPRGAWPPGAVLHSATGRLLWTPTEAQGPSTNVLAIDVVDNGMPSQAATVSLKVLVGERNQAPTITAPADAQVAEGSLFRGLAVASDGDLPKQKLTFGLVGTPPAGMTIVPETGELTWQPDEAQGPSTNVIKIRVSDDGTPTRSATAVLTVTVTEKNEAPKLKPVPDQVVPAESGLVVTLSASDADLPAQSLSFSFEGAKPAGMSLDPQTGRLTWLPAANQRPSSHSITVKVTDDGVPSRSALRSFVVQALAATEISAPVLEYEALADGSLRLSWDSVPGVTYRLQRSPDLQSGSWQLVEEFVAGEDRSVRTLGTSLSARFFRLAVP